VALSRTNILYTVRLAPLIRSEPCSQPSLSLYPYHCSTLTHRVAGPIFFTLFPLLPLVHSALPLPISVPLFRTHSQGYRTNILYIVPLTPIGSLRAPAPALPLPISVPCSTLTHRVTGPIFFTLFSLLPLVHSALPLPISVPLFRTHSQGYRTNILYTVPSTLVGLLRTPALSPPSPYICIMFHTQGLQDQYSLYSSPYSYWFPQSPGPGPSPPSPYICTMFHTHRVAGP
jgi:hypothetical protein